MKVYEQANPMLNEARKHMSNEDYSVARSAGIKRFNTAMYEIRTTTATAKILDAMQRHVDIWTELSSAAVEEDNWFVVVYCSVARAEMTETMNLVAKLLDRMVEGIGEDNDGN